MKWAEFVALLTWIAGVVMAKGFWSTFFAIVFPPWAIYLVLEYLLTIWSVV